MTARYEWCSDDRTGSGAHPASCSMGAGCLYGGGVMRPKLGVNYPLPFSAEVKERVELYLYSLSLSLSGPLGPVLG